ncbi:MAG: glycosyltransferase family 2 protein [Clostridiales bacterium]|nr:glycosyltransferase family 2 protein [Clostridiales bacterium]
MVTISLCMIVKNEEAVLSRCLDSVKDLVDEIVIVDTGSTDRTREIAADYTDKIYDFAWTGSFADARNFSFSKATKEYIYCADADEVLDEENRERFRILKQTLLPEIEIVQMYYCNQMQYNTVYNFDKEYRPKLYKRLREFVWEEPVHEAVRLEPIIYDSDVEILHLPQGEHAGRDLAVFERMAAQEVHISKRLHNLYAKELFLAGEDEDFERAVPAFLRTMDETDRSVDELLEAECVLCHAARIMGNDGMFFQYAMKGIAAEGCSELCYELGEFYKAKGNETEAVLWYYNAAYETKPVIGIRYGGDYPLARLAECYRLLGQPEQAADYLAEAENWKQENLPME